MKRKLFLITFLAIQNWSFSQTLEDTLKTNITTFFSAMQSNDTVLLKELLVENCELKSIVNVDGKQELDILPYKKFIYAISKPVELPWDEKILNYTFLRDEMMATVWTDYEFIYDGKLSHSGVNQFTFLKDKNSKYGWKILSIIDTRYVQMKGDISKMEHQNSERKNINQLMNDWHLAATNAKIDNFFSFMSDSCIYKGTDQTERWNKTEFHKFCKPFFDKGKAWDFKPIERHISFDDNLQTAWLDEKLETWMGICKATGVLQKENGVWKLLLYDLSVTIDNNKIKSFIDINK